MGTASSTRQQLGERVLNIRAKLEAAKKFQSERLQQLPKDTQDVIVKNIGVSFQQCAPFSESLLLVAFAANPEDYGRRRNASWPRRASRCYLRRFASSSTSGSKCTCFPRWCG